MADDGADLGAPHQDASLGQVSAANVVVMFVDYQLDKILHRMRTPPLDDRYDTLSGMLNVNDTSMEGGSATINWNLADGWWFKSVTAFCVTASVG